MSRELKRSLYRIFIMLLALFFKILIIQDVFMFLTRLVFGYNNFSSVLYIVLASATVGIVVGETMYAREKNNPRLRQNAIDYFAKHEVTFRESARYSLRTNGEIMDYVMYTVTLFIVLGAVYTVRMIVENWQYVFEALICFVVILATTVATELIKKNRLYYYLMHKDEFDNE